MSSSTRPIGRTSLAAQPRFGEQLAQQRRFADAGLAEDEV